MTKHRWRFERLVCSVMVVLCLAGPAWSQQTTPEPLGLAVRDGVLTLAGKPYRGIGANFYDLFYRRLRRPTETTYKERLHQLSQAGIPFVRFSGAGFWPVDWDLYFKNKEAYFTLLDEVVRAAEQEHVGLIPSLFWYMATVPDLSGEPIDQLGNPDSKSIAFIRRYTEEVVARYKNSSAIWGWEFGNEYSLSADLPNAAEHRPYVVPSNKTPTTRTARDEMRSEHAITAFVEFAKAVRKHDRHRIILTGNSLPRANAYHNTLERSWKPDTLEQFTQIVLRDNPAPFDMISVHLYPEEGNRHPAFAKDLKSLIRTIQDLSVRVDKPLFIGEFGVPISLGPQEGRAIFEEFLALIEANRVPLSAFWVFDYAPQDKDWNVSFPNERAYMIELVAKANQRIQRQLRSPDTRPGTERPGESK